MMTRQKSRRVRFEDALGKIADVREEIEELRNELQEWLDNMPENLLESEKASQLEDAIECLNEVVGLAEEIEASDVEFPSMFG